MPGTAFGDAEPCRLVLQGGTQFARTDMLEAPVQVARQTRQRVQEVVIALLLDLATNRQDHHGVVRVTAVAARARHRRSRQMGEIEAMIDELQAPPVVIWIAIRFRRQLLEALQAHGRAGHQPVAVGKLAGDVPGPAGPDVLGVRRHAPRQAAEGSGVTRHRGGRVQEVSIKVLDRLRQLGRQHERLAPAAQAIGRGIAPEVGAELGERCRIARQAARLKPARQHAARVVLEIFGQIGDAGLDAVVDRMARLVGGFAQRPDLEVNAARLEAGDFLRDEGLGKTRPTLQHDRYART